MNWCTYCEFRVTYSASSADGNQPPPPPPAASSALASLEAANAFDYTDGTMPYEFPMNTKFTPGAQRSAPPPEPQISISAWGSVHELV